MRVLFILGLFSIISFSAYAERDERYRFRLIQDKNRTLEILRPFGHDFFLDITGYMSKGLPEFVKKAREQIELGGTLLDQEARILAFLSQNSDIEHFGNGIVKIGIPLPSFSLGGLKLSPDLRASYDLGASLSLTGRPGAFTTNIPGFGTVTTNITDPTLGVYIQQDMKAGLSLDWDYEKYLFGNVATYYMARYDRAELIKASNVVLNNQVVSFDEPKNTKAIVAMDFKLGMQREKFKGFISVEELKLKNMADKVGVPGIKNNGDLYLTIDPLYRAHLSYTIDMDLVNWIPFTGVHKRRGYSASDAFYFGSELFVGLFPLSVAGQWDSEYMSITPRLRLWGVLQLEYTARLPHRTKTDGFTIPYTHVANFRLSF